MPPAILELRQVTKRYGREATPALRNATFAVVEGERACLLGPNGAGKTTIVRLLQGALDPTKGQALVAGVPSGTSRFIGARRLLGVVPQMPGMYDDLHLSEYLSLVQRLYRCPPQPELVEKLGLELYLKRPLAALSGGFQRRAVLAAALLPDPPVLVLDEPTVGLDPVAARDVRDVLREAMRGRTVLFCTHNLAEAEALCDSAIILRSGEVLVHELIQNLRGRLSPVVQLAARGGPQALAATLRDLGLNPVQAAGDGAASAEPVRLPLEEPERDVPPLLRRLLEGGLDVYEVHTVRPSLEDLFFRTMDAAAETARTDRGNAPSEAHGTAPTLALPQDTGWWSQIGPLMGKELRQLPRKRSALLTAVILPVLILLLMPLLQMFSLARLPATLAQSRGVPAGVPLPETIGIINRDPAAAFRLLTFPLLILVGGLMVPSVMAAYTVVVERERRTLDLLVALPVSLPAILIAKLATTLLVACAVTVPLLTVDVIAASMSRLLSAGDGLVALLILLAALAYSTTAALVVGLVAGDFRTANNVSGAMVGPLILVGLAMILLLPQGVAGLALVALLLGLAVVSLAATLRWLSIERLLK
jgi:ABC-2 type transport system ATP-binding protein